ncbi:hypothetical protein V2J52_04060 [Georgenia sp. MJ173]|uniref:hypothetical protein n=1 Tax=Georgenia sunbinii TaxID=3117728 RepID=UPI002F266FA9
MSIDSPAPTSPPAADQQAVKREPSAPRLSTLQIVASALAAMTTTALLATLGVAGTIIGAALASVITVLANFVYTASLSRTADKVAATVPVKKVRSRNETAVAGAPDRPRAILVAGELVDVDVAAASPDGVAPDGLAPDGATAPPAQRPEGLRSVVERVGWRRIGGATAMVLVLVLTAVTVVELTAGRALTDIVRHQEGSGTSLFGTAAAPPSAPVEHGDAPGSGPADVPAPSPEEVVTPEPTDTPTPDPTETPTEPATPEHPTPTPPAEDVTPAPQDPPTSPAPGDEETSPPADDDAPVTEPRPTPEPTPSPAP